MDFCTEQYLDTKSLRPSSSKKSFKQKHRKFEETCQIETNDNTVLLNLNKNKNWKLKKQIKNQISHDPEFGTKLETKKNVIISTFEPGTNNVIETLTYSKKSLPIRNDKINFKSEQKFGHSILKDNYDKGYKKILKTKSKRQIAVCEDIKVVGQNSSKNYDKLIRPAINNLDKLIENVDQNRIKFKAFEDPVCFESKIYLPKQIKPSFRQIESNSECLICLNETQSQLIINECNHGCCEECWNGYVSQKFPFGELFCFYTGCGTKLELDLLEYLLPREKYEKNITKILGKNNFIECLGSCNNFFNLNCGFRFPKCVCGFSMCMTCKSESHFPINCESFQFYLTLLKENKNLDNKVIFKGKFCPSCKMLIEKTGGCPHMTCVCGCEFCWDCLKNYSNTHSGCLPVKEFSFSIEDLESKNIRILFEQFSYQETISKKLISILDKEKDFLAQILKNEYCQILCAQISDYITDPKNCTNLIKQILRYSFYIIEKADRSIELLFAEEIFNRISQIQQNHEKVLIRKGLTGLCKGLNKILSMKTVTLSKIIPLINQIFLLLQKLKTMNK